MSSSRNRTALKRQKDVCLFLQNFSDRSRFCPCLPDYVIGVRRNDLRIFVIVDEDIKVTRFFERKDAGLISPACLHKHKKRVFNVVGLAHHFELDI